ncbi:MAG: hypothetical protein K2H22_06375 [Muribaculaceae bacterium]|nr:hypothetical protein [Muribaculaceae bacterium]
MKKTIIAGIACLGLLSACSNEADIPEYDDIKTNPVKAIWPDRPLKAIGTNNALKANEFATELFRKAYAKERGNTCISPASVFLTLAMTANADDGECRDEILDILGYDTGETGLNELNAYSNALLVEVPDFNGDTQCGFTNSLWHSPYFNLLPSFTDNLKEIFGAADVEIWLGDEKGRNAINQFVEENTRGMIKEFLKVPLQTDLGILNTTYFKGTWKQKFDEKHTSKGNFQNLDGSSSRTNFMTLTDMMEYSYSDYATSVRLPYAGERYTMTLIMPDEDIEFNDMLRDLDGKHINDVTSRSRVGKVELKLPRFQQESNSNIIRILKEMGLDRTCFPGIMKATGSPLELQTFQHAVKIIVNEKGTEGGAASLGGFYGTSLPNPEAMPAEHISFDRPFIYMIQDNISGTVLFMGAVTSL